MNNVLASVRPAADTTTLPSRSDILVAHATKTRSEISLLEDQRRQSNANQTRILARESQLKDELAKLQAEGNTEALRTEAIDKLLRVRRHMLADLESDRA